MNKNSGMKSGMKSSVFWTLTCLSIVLATVLFSGWSPAATPPANRMKTIRSAMKPRPIIKIGRASYVLVRIGKPYIYELCKPDCKK